MWLLPSSPCTERHVTKYANSHKKLGFAFIFFEEGSEKPLWFPLRNKKPNLQWKIFKLKENAFQHSRLENGDLYVNSNTHLHGVLLFTKAGSFSQEASQSRVGSKALELIHSTNLY